MKLWAKKKLSSESIDQIILHRYQGLSIAEISTKLNIPKTTVFRYVQEVKVSPEFHLEWLGKRGGSKKRKSLKEQEALKNAKDIINDLSIREKMLFLCALYWGEGNKKEFILTNTDPVLVRLFVTGLRDIFGINNDEIRISIRVYSDLNTEKCLDFWSNIVDIPKDRFLKTTILEGKKNGKLEYGMCRVRIARGTDLLKKVLAINKVFVQEWLKTDTI